MGGQARAQSLATRKRKRSTFPVGREHTGADSAHLFLFCHATGRRGHHGHDGLSGSDGQSGLTQWTNLVTLFHHVHFVPRVHRLSWILLTARFAKLRIVIYGTIASVTATVAASSG